MQRTSRKALHPEGPSVNAAHDPVTGRLPLETMMMNWVLRVTKKPLAAHRYQFSLDMQNMAETRILKTLVCLT